MRIILILFLSFFASLTIGQIDQMGIIGPAASGSWDEEEWMTQDATNKNLWTATIDLEEGELKFRANGNWGLNWGGIDFPEGIGTEGGNNIPVLEGQYQITFNTESATYSFKSTGNTTGSEYDPTLPPDVRVETGGNNVYSGAKINFATKGKGEINRYFWVFEGGTPNFSREANPSIRYEKSGAYDVGLIVSNDYGADTIKLLNYITVKDRNKAVTGWWNEAVFYEIFVRSFNDSDGDGIGDINGMTQKLDYLQDLGITGIWLMPINESPSYHGYDVTDYRSINSDYGTMDDFKVFLKEAHDRGIRVIIDYVMNHSSSQNPWFLDSGSSTQSKKRSWYIWSEQMQVPANNYGMHDHESGGYYGTFSAYMPDLNYAEPAVKKEMFDISTYWLKEIGVDGFRLDAVKYLVEEDGKLENSTATFQLFKDFRAHYKSINPDAFAVGEAWTSTDMVLKYVEDGGLDYCFDFDQSFAYTRGLRKGEAKRISDQLQSSYNVYPHLQYGTFLTNHDQTRIMDALDYDVNKVKVGASIYLTAPGIPYIYYGEEIGQKGSKPDEYIRTPMQWSAEAAAGFTSGEPWIAPNDNYPAFNVASAKADSNSLFNHYQKLIALRNNNECLTLGDFQIIPTNQESIVAYLRTYGNLITLVVVNISDQQLNSVELNLSNTMLKPSIITSTDVYNEQILQLKISNEKHLIDHSIKPFGTQIIRLFPDF